MCLGIPGEVVAVHEQDGLPFGKVRFGGTTREVCLAYQPAARPGDFVLVHVGFAIATIDRLEAERVWRLLEELGEAGGAPDPGEAPG